MKRNDAINSSNTKYVSRQLEERQLSRGIKGLVAADTSINHKTYVYAQTKPDVTPSIHAPNAVAIPTTRVNTQEIVFVDTSVSNYQVLLDDKLNISEGNIEVIFLENSTDGIEQITNVLSKHQNLDAIHIMSHGENGGIRLGNMHLDQAALYQNQLSFVSWAESFSLSGNILIYGCKLDQTEVGKDLIRSISELTLTDVEASTEITGHESLHDDYDVNDDDTLNTIEIIDPDTTMDALAIVGDNATLALGTIVTVDADNAIATGTDHATTWTQGGGAIRITDTDAVLSNIDNANLLSISVSITNHWDTLNEVLSANTVGTGISAFYNSVTGVLMLSGIDTVANYQQVLRSISYDNTHATPVGGDRTIEFVVNDATRNSAVATSTFSMQTNVNVLVVTNTSDTVDGDTRSICALYANDGGDGISLREAILAANNSPNGTSPDVIRFDMAGTGPHVISLSSALPLISRAVIIDGSNSDFANTPEIILDGNGLIQAAITLSSGASGSTIANLIIRDIDYGIVIQNGSNNNTISGNWIGQFNAGGSDAGANKAIGHHAIYVKGSNNIIGGTSESQRNIIIGGVHLYGSSAVNNTVMGNYFGTDTSGNALLASSLRGSGISAENGSNNNTIGGASTAHRNIFGGLGTAIDIKDADTHAFVIQNNWIGLSANGQTVLANDAGILIHSSDNHIIGGAGSGNLILGSFGEGIGLLQKNENLTIQGNYIGSNASGLLVAGNNIGIRIGPYALNNLIGGVNLNEGNTITASTNAGVLSDAGVGISGNSFLGNTIYGNGGLGININNDGVTNNDSGDDDIESNNLQNCPLLSAVVHNGDASITVRGALNSNANTTYRIEFFANAQADTSGHGEAQRFLGFATLTTNTGGDAIFVKNINQSVAAGESITATATIDLGGGNYADTSEFASNKTAVLNQAPVNSIVAPQTVDENTLLYFTGLSVYDVNDNLAFIELAVVNGVLNVNVAAGAAISSGANNSKNLTLRGSQAQINAALATLSYQGDLQFSGVDNLTVLSRDSALFPLSDSDSIAITVSATNEAATIADIDSGEIKEDTNLVDNKLSSSGTLIISDPNSGESIFKAETINGIYGDLSIDTAGNWRYEANNAKISIQQLDVYESVTDTLTVRSVDNTRHNIVVTLNGSEDKATIAGTTTGSVVKNVTLTSSGTLLISDTDTNDNPISFNNVSSVRSAMGFGNFQLIDNNWTYTLNNEGSVVKTLLAGQILSDSITFIASDGSNQAVKIKIYGNGSASSSDPAFTIAAPKPSESKPAAVFKGLLKFFT